MSHRVRTLLLLLIVGLTTIALQPSANLHAAANHPAATAATGDAIEPVAHIGGLSNASTVDGSLLYINEANTLTIIDVSDPNQPVRRSSIQLPNVIDQIEVLDGFAYLDTGETELVVVDVRNPDQPVVRGSYQAEGFIYHLEVQAGLVYIAIMISEHEIAQFQIIDVRNPDLPVLRGKYRGALHFHDFEVVGDLAYLAAEDSRSIQILDVSNPASPTLRGQYTDQKRIFYSLKVVGNRMYARSGGPGDHISIIDATNPGRPILLGSYSDAANSADWLYVEATTMYLTEADGKVRMIDVSDPEHPKPRGVYTSPGRIYSGAFADNSAYLLLNTHLTIVDLSNPGSPAPRGSMILVHDITSTHVAGDLAFSVAQKSGLHIFDVSDPAKPVLRGVYRDSHTTTDQVLGNVIVQDDLAYLATETTLKIIDVSNPDSPTLRGEYAGLNAFPLLRISGDRLYIANGNRLYIFDVSNPFNPALLATPAVAAEAIMDLNVVDNLAYLTTGYCGFGCFGYFEIVDLSDADNPVRLAQLGMDATGRLSVVGNLVYIASSAVKIFDVSDPTSPVLRNTYTAAGSAVALEIVDGLMYVLGQDGSTLHIADLTHPAQPRPRATYPIPYRTERIHAANNHVYLSRGSLLIFRVDPAQFPPSIYAPIAAKPS